MSKPLMPKATAVWLVDNTSLTFEQIAEFCGLHPLEVKGIADGEVAVGIQGMDPVAAGQLTRTQIERGETEPGYALKLKRPEIDIPEPQKKAPRYTPVSRRQDRPNAIAWLVRNHPEMADAQICKLVGTTKPTITAIRDRSHWNINNIQPQDPVTLGLCSQIELDSAVGVAREKQRKLQEKENRVRRKAEANQLADAEAADMPSTRPQPGVHWPTPIASEAPQPDIPREHSAEEVFGTTATPEPVEEEAPPRAEDVFGARPTEPEKQDPESPDSN